MNIKDLNVGDILEWSSSGNRSELVMVVSVFKTALTPSVKVEIISSTRKDRIGYIKTFTHKTLNRHRTVKYIA